MRLHARNAHLPPARSGARAASRRGITLLELMVVMCLVSLLTGLAVPRLRHASNLMAVRAAKNDLATALAVARGAAIQKGRTSRMIVRGNRVIVTVDTAPNNLFMTLVDRDMKALHRVTLTKRNDADSIVPFDARGFARTGSGSTAIYALTGPSSSKGQSNTDSLCVSHFGLISKRGCIR